MKLDEMFDKKNAMAQWKKEKKEMTDGHDTSTSDGDMVITQFEMGKISFNEAKQLLRDKGLEVYFQELNMADELKNSKTKDH